MSFYVVINDSVLYNIVMERKEITREELEKMVLECIEEQKKIGLKPAENIKVFIDYSEDIHCRIGNDVRGVAVYVKSKDMGFLGINSTSLKYEDENRVRATIHHELIHLNLTPNKNILVHTKQNWKKFERLCNMVEKAYPQYKMHETFSPEIFHPENKGREVKTYICPVCEHIYSFFENGVSGVCGICRSDLEELKKA